MEDQNLVPKGRKISMKTDENARWKSFACDLMSFI